MAGLKVFVSSTCYDLSSIRTQLRSFLISLGHEPIMSEYSDILYDFRVHTHNSCIEEVKNADVVILIIGSRFGGNAIPEAINRIDVDSLKAKSKSTTALEGRNLSVTQLEILKAIDVGIPVFPFIDSSVLHDHLFYEKNKGKPFINEIKFPSVEKNDTAPYIFEFINFLRQKDYGNSIFPFSSPIDIEDIIKKQFSLLLQRLISEQRNSHAEMKRIDNLTEQFEELKTAMLASFGDTINKEAAKGVIKYRRLYDVLISLGMSTSSFINNKLNWLETLESLGIDKILPLETLPEHVRERLYGDSGRRFSSSRTLIIKKDKKVYECRFPVSVFHNCEMELEQFIHLQDDVKKTIAESIREFARPEYLALKELVINSDELFSSPVQKMLDIENDDNRIWFSSESKHSAEGNFSRVWNGERLFGSASQDISLNDDILLHQEQGEHTKSNGDN